MRLYSNLITCLLVLASLPARPQWPAVHPEFRVSMDSLFRTLSGNQPGIAFSIGKGDAILYQNAAGVAGLTTAAQIDSTTNFRMASVTKQFTAMAILLLEKNHQLSLDDPIGHWLPELPRDIGQKVLVRHLLTHSSGLLDYESLIPDTQKTQVLDADVLRLLARHDSTYFPPGTRFRYSNTGFCLLALIVERAAHQPFRSFVEGHIFRPLRMDHSAIYQQDHPIYHRAMGYALDSNGAIIPSDQSVTSATKGDGGVYTSLTDYAKWSEALQRKSLLDLDASLHRLRFPLTDGTKDRYYAAGWFLAGDNPLILFHSGSTCGFSTYVVRIPHDDWSITYFSNLAGNTAPFREILKILHRYGMPDLLPVLQLQDLTR